MRWTLPAHPLPAYRASSVVAFFSASFATFGGLGRFIERLIPLQNDSTLRDLVAAGDQVFENRLVPVQACVRHELHPVPARRFVGRLREPVPDRHVRLARHEIWTLRGGARTLDRLVDQHPVGEIELEVLLIEIEVYRL